MSQRHTDIDSNSTPATCDLVPFLRNRYFTGKLLTTRDMQAEQDYHAGRLETLGQHVAGEGVVCGLETAVSTTEDGLAVTVEPGLAIDACGRPIVVAEPAEAAFSDAESADGDGSADEIPDADTISIYLRLVEEATETVPRPGTGDACSEDCEHNRIYEGFAIELGGGEPNGKPIPTVDFPTKAEKETIADAAPREAPLGALSTPARTYAGSTTDGWFGFDPCGTEGDPQVFLGCFVADGDDGWERKPESVQRHYVYTNDMLYSSILSHATDLGNPHDVLTSVDGVDHVDGNVEIESPSGTVESSDGGDGTVNLDVDEAALEDVVKTVHGVAPDGSGDVEFASPSETIEPSQGDDGVVNLDVDVSALGDVGGGIETIEGAGPAADGDVAFESPSGTIESDDAGTGVVNLDLSEELRTEHEVIGEYVRDKVLKYKLRTFYEVAERYVVDNPSDAEQQANELAREIVRAARDALDEMVFRGEMAFALAVLYLAVLEAELYRAVSSGGLANQDGIEDVERVLRRLEELLPDELWGWIENADRPTDAWESLVKPDASPDAFREFVDEWEGEFDVTTLAVIGDQLAETAGWLERPEATMTLPGGEEPVPARIIRTAIDRPGRG